MFNPVGDLTLGSFPCTLACILMARIFVQYYVNLCELSLFYWWCCWSSRWNQRFWWFLRPVSIIFLIHAGDVVNAGHGMDMEICMWFPFRMKIWDLG